MTLVFLPKATKHECGEAFPEVPQRTCLSGPHPKQLGRSEQSISQWRPKYSWADVSEGKWSGVTGRKKRKRKRDKGEWGSEGDRQRLGPTYNREHERAQNVPQWSPGDGRERRHHTLEPRQPTLTKTTAIHTHREEIHTWTCKFICISLTQWYFRLKLQHLHNECGWQNWNSSFFYQDTVSLSTSVEWFRSPTYWLFTA